MITDRYTKVLMTFLVIALFLNGLNPWISPPQAVAVEATDTGGKDNDCSSYNKTSTETLEEINNMKRLLGYIESSVNTIQLTISGIDRKLNDFPSNSHKERN
ncbi:MAG: hypothetical protein HOL15_08235 [Nitrospinaceae bacterium]|jgi:hypothetical protein|nr:hypothetical protein [Nitrospina sp.]MBT5376784.1 hypothetical protein [Nitrospinaceae bacterium]MBT6345765.1 hypothetical protein [Nitrospina sp.]